MRPFHCEALALGLVCAICMVTEFALVQSSLHLVVVLIVCGLDSELLSVSLTYGFVLKPQCK